MGHINFFSYVTGVGMCSWNSLTISVMLLGRIVFMGYISFFSYVTHVGLCSWVTLTISVVLQGSACVH